MEEEKKISESDLHDKDCSICFTIMVEPIKLECNHRFCIQCISKLFVDPINRKCPICRAVVPQDLQIDKKMIDVFFANKL